MKLDVKVVDGKSIDCVIKESHVTDKVLSLLLQEVGKEECRIVNVPISNVTVKYSDSVNEPRMRLETIKAVPRSWFIRNFGLSSFGPALVAHIDVPTNYQGILGTYAGNTQ